MGFILVVLLIVGVIAVIYGTVNKNGMGVNLKKANNCPKCDAELPMVRAPGNLNEMLFGGWTCKSCGTQIDKWGRAR